MLVKSNSRNCSGRAAVGITALAPNNKHKDYRRVGRETSPLFREGTSCKFWYMRKCNAKPHPRQHKTQLLEATLHVDKISCFKPSAAATGTILNRHFVRSCTWSHLCLSQLHCHCSITRSSTYLKYFSKHEIYEWCTEFKVVKQATVLRDYSGQISGNKSSEERSANG